MLNSKKAKPELTDRFRDGPASEMAAGRRCYLGKSSACYKLGNYRPLSMKLGTQTKTDMQSSKITKAEVYGHFPDGRRCYLGKLLSVKEQQKLIV
jgi:hypothetical protein